MTCGVNTKGNLLMFSNEGYECKKILFGKNVYFINNKVGYIMYFSYMAVHMTGTMVVSHNTVKSFIVKFEFCEITWTKMITFLSNICDYVIYLKSLELPYVKVIDYANITFTNNTYYHQLIFYDSLTKEDNGVFPYCFF